MKTTNFNLLNHEALIQLGFSKDEITAINAMRPLPNLFHLLKIPELEPNKLGDLLQQGIVISPNDQMLVPNRVSLLPEEDLAIPDPDCFCVNDGGDGEAAENGGDSANPMVPVDDDPFGIFQPLNPKRPVRIERCDQEVVVPLVGLGKVVQKVSLAGLTPQEEFQKVQRTVDFVSRFAKVKALGSRAKALLRVIQNAVSACKDPKCPNPNLFLTNASDGQVFAIALPATRGDGTLVADTFVVYALHIARITAVLSCTKRKD